MPRYYCDYCDTYLTHDSPSVRKQHNAGYKHKANIRAYYQKFEEQQTQIMLDQKIKEHLGQAAVYQQIGAAYNQHLAAFPGVRPRLPIMPPPMLQIPGAGPPQLPLNMRPPILPIPVAGAPVLGYATAHMMPPPPATMQPPPTSSLPPPPNGVLTSFSSSPGGPSPSASSAQSVPAQSSHEFNPSVAAAAPDSATAGGYSYAQSSQTNL